jgi:hypothetical protein
MGTIFRSAPVFMALWLDVLLVGLAAFILVELEKRLRPRRDHLTFLP